MLTTFAKTSNISNKPGLTLANAGDYCLGKNFLPNDEAKVKEGNPKGSMVKWGFPLGWPMGYAADGG